jgi:Cys-rich repeat protein
MGEVRGWFPSSLFFLGLGGGALAFSMLASACGGDDPVPVATKPGSGRGGSSSSAGSSGSAGGGSDGGGAGASSAAKTCTDDSACEEDVGAPRCDLQSQVCVACIEDADCGEGGSCELSAHECFVGECHKDEDCDQGFCKLPESYCVECLDNSACKTSRYGATCDLEAHFCGCTADPDCATAAQGPHCVVGACGCNSDAECTSPGAKHCVQVGDETDPYAFCAECGTDADCVGNPAGAHCEADFYVCTP